MSNWMVKDIQATKAVQMTAIENVLIKGDLSQLNEGQRIEYYRGLCSTLGLNPLSRPFDYITLNGKLTLYAKKDATDQLRASRNVSLRVSARELIGDVYVVTTQAKLPGGREDESTGAVPVAGLKGDALANAYMKAETKSKRRVTLSICGLGILDETEVESIPAQDRAPAQPPRIAPEQPAPGDGVAHAETENSYRIGFGKYRGRGLHEINPDDLANYCGWLQDNAQKTGKALGPDQLQFVDRATYFLESLSQGDPEPGSSG